MSNGRKWTKAPKVTNFILPAEFVGMAVPEADGSMIVGDVKVPWDQGSVGVYVRRMSRDLTVAEIHLTRHDGLMQEELDNQNAEADRYPAGAKEYWRGVMVGKYLYGADHHLMTNEDFEEDWEWDSADD